MAALDRAIPTWVKRWLLISAIICIIDGGFCVVRPHSLPGGCLEMIFYPYQYYIKWDLHYADTTDSFVWAQGFANLIESALNLVIVFNLLKSVRMSKLLAIFVSAMTFWKTIIFCLYSFDVGQGGHTFDLVAELMVFGPALIWIGFPAYTAWVLMQDFCDIRRKPDIRKVANGNDVTDSPRTKYNLRHRK